MADRDKTARRGLMHGLRRRVGDYLSGSYILSTVNRELTLGNTHQAAHAAVALQLGNTDPCSEGRECAFNKPVYVPGEPSRMLTAHYLAKPSTTLTPALAPLDDLYPVNDAVTAALAMLGWNAVTADDDEFLNDLTHLIADRIYVDQTHAADGESSDAGSVEEELEATGSWT